MPHIRPFRPGDLDRLREITVEAFNGVSIDQNAEAMFGLINGRDWRWRKGRHVDDDARRDPSGIFILAEGDEVLGGITTWIDRESGIGHIPNLAIAPQLRGQGWGRKLIEHALDHFRRNGVAFARIETLEQNEIGQRLYTSFGFREAARQIHYFMPLNTAAESSPENTP
mgnify:CR=1 FL=1